MQFPAEPHTASLRAANASVVGEFFLEFWLWCLPAMTPTAITLALGAPTTDSQKRQVTARPGSQQA